jgi:hypothetical protein
MLRSTFYYEYTFLGYFSPIPNGVIEERPSFYPESIGSTLYRDTPIHMASDPSRRTLAIHAYHSKTAVIIYRRVAQRTQSEAHKPHCAMHGLVDHRLVIGCWSLIFRYTYQQTLLFSDAKHNVAM